MNKLEIIQSFSEKLSKHGSGTVVEIVSYSGIHLQFKALEIQTYNIEIQLEATSGGSKRLSFGLNDGTPFISAE